MAALNPHPSPSPLQKRLLGEVVEAASRCYELGWTVATAGNFSIRGNPGIVWQSPSGVPKGSLSPRSFIAINEETARPVLDGYVKPSDETPLHVAVYQRFPEVRAVLHAHPPGIVTQSLRRGQLVLKGHEMAKALGYRDHESEVDIDMWPNSQNMVDLADRFSCASIVSPFLVLKGHGIYAWGPDVKTAFARMEAVEYLCQTLG